VRFKLDENLSAQLGPLLNREGHDVETVLSERLGGKPDDELFEACVAERRVLLTLDLDFANPLRFPPQRSAGIVVLRPVRPTLRLIQSTVSAVLLRFNEQALEGRLWIVEPGRIRLYEPED
jgi:predicted nuclease of predicted toxin-antitoxin system